MAGLLGNGWDDPQSQAIMALSSGLLSANGSQGLGAGLLGANNAVMAARQEAIKRQLMQAQIDETRAQAQERAVKTQREQAALEAAQRKAAALPGLLGIQPPGGVSAPAGMGPAQGMANQTGGPPQLDVRRMLLEGYTTKEINDIAATMRNGNMDKVARTIESRDAQGRPIVTQHDEYGRAIGAPAEQWKAPVFEGLGNRRAAIDPVTMKEIGSFGIAQSPDSLASTAVTMRGQNLTDTRAREATDAGKVPAGYRRNSANTGLEFIPGGPADPDAAKRAALTESQGNATAFAARMQDASKVIDALQAGTSPTQVARAGYKPEFPGWVPGGQIASAGITAANKLTTPDNAQLYRQAQENWVTANLRKESGAAISKDEMNKDIAKWFPQPGEPDSLIDQKSAARKVAERAMLVQAGPGASHVQSIVDGASQTPARATAAGATPTMRWNPKTQKVEMVN